MLITHRDTFNWLVNEGKDKKILFKFDNKTATADLVFSNENIVVVFESENEAETFYREFVQEYREAFKINPSITDEQIEDRLNIPSVALSKSVYGLIERFNKSKEKMVLNAKPITTRAEIDNYYMVGVKEKHYGSHKIDNREIKINGLDYNDLDEVYDVFYMFTDKEPAEKYLKIKNDEILRTCGEKWFNEYQASLFQFKEIIPGEMGSGSEKTNG